MNPRPSESKTTKYSYRPTWARLSIEQLEERLAPSIDFPPDLVLGRTLSDYTTQSVQNQSVAVTYTVYNQREVELANVSVGTTLQSGISLTSSSVPATQNGQHLGWSLGTIPAYGRASVTITVGLPSTTTTSIDTGASAVATIDAGTSTAETPAITLSTQTILPNLLDATPDANVNDPFVQEQAAKLRYDPQRIFDFLNHDIGYESYVGSLRGSRGTLWSQAGNSLDEASLGIALFRASGIPARYAQGTLSDANSRSLILTMFPEVTQIAGYLEPGTVVSDPANDPALLAQTRNHFWIQIDTGAGFQNVDTSGLPGAAIGTAFTTVSNTFNVVDDALRHKVRLSLLAETYSEATAAFSHTSGITTQTVLDRTWNAVELVGRPITVSQFVDENAQGGLAFTSRALTYTPYFITGDVADPLGVNDDLTTGTAFDELLTNFPFGSTILTGLKLNVDLSAPGAGTEHHESTLVDRIGYAARQNSSASSFSVDANGKPALSNYDVTTVFVTANKTLRRDPVALEQQLRNQQARVEQAIAAGGPLSAATQAEFKSFNYNLSRLMGDRYLRTMDGVADSAAIARVKAYWDQTRIILTKLSQVPQTGTEPATTRVLMDLLHEHVRAVAEPKQAMTAEFGFRFHYGIMAGQVERAAMASLVAVNSPSQALSIVSLVEAAEAQGVPFVLLVPQDRAILSSMIVAPPDVLARIDAALVSGKFVQIPARPVLFQGQPRLGWYEIDPLTGSTIDVLDTGEHVTLIEFKNQVLASLTFDNVIAFATGYFIGQLVGAGIGKQSNLTQASFGAITFGTTLILKLLDHLEQIPTLLTGALSQPLYPAFNAGFDTGIVAGSLIAAVDPPAEGQFFGALTRPTSHRDDRALTLAATPGLALSVTPATTSSATDQNTAVTIPITVAANVAGDYLLTAIAPVGWAVSLTDTAVTITPAPGTQSGSGTVRLVARSKADPSRVARAEIQIAVDPTSPGLSLEVPVDPLLTVSFQGAELPTAYRAVIRNLGPVADDYTIQITNVTPGWEVITSADGVQLPAGTTGIVGVYLRPTGATLPVPGAPIGFTLTATSASNPASTDTVVVGLSVPTVAATWFYPDTIEMSIVPGAVSDHKITVVNRGNITETVTVSGRALPAGFSTTGLPLTVTVAPGQSVEVPYTIAIDSTVAFNSVTHLTLSIDKLRTGQSRADFVNVAIRAVVPGADEIAASALSARSLGQIDLADRLTALTIALTDLVSNPTNAIANSQAIAALDAVIRIVNADPILSSQFANSLTFARNQLEASTTTQQVQSALDFLASQLTSLSQVLSDLVLHGFTFSLAANVVTALPGVPARFPIVLENTGTEATTFDLSLGSSLPFGMSATFDQQTITLQPGQRINGGPGDPALNLSFTGNSLFPEGFTVVATPQEAPYLARRVTASVAVRSEFVQVAAVRPEPAFTQPGGIVAISSRILNVVNREQSILASYRVLDANGATVFTSASVRATLTISTSLIDVTLPSFDTTGLTLGNYSLVVTLTDAAGTPIPGGTGQASLLVGTPVSATLSVSPDSLFAGSSTVTNTLRLDARTTLPNPLSLAGQVQTTPTSTTLLVNGTIAYVAGTNGIDIVDISNPASPSVVGTFGQSEIVSGNFTVVRAMAGNRIVIATSATLNAGSFRLLTYSVTNPTAPVLLGESTIDEAFITDLFVVGSNTAFATTNGVSFFAGNVLTQFGDVIALDLTDPNAVVKTHELFGDGADNFNHTGGELVNASTLYVASTSSTGSQTQQGEGIVRVLDVSNAASITQLKQLTIPGTVQVLEIAVNGNRALVVGSTGGWKSPFFGVNDAQLTGRMTLTLLDISDPANPTIIGTTLITDSFNRPVDTADGGAKQSMVSLGNGTFAISRGFVNGAPVLLLVDTTDDLLAVAAIAAPALVNEMAVDNGRLFTTSQAGLLIYDVVAMASTHVTASVTVPNTAGNHVRVDSFNIAPDQRLAGPGTETLVWTRPFAFGNTSSTLTWQTDLTDLIPGESRDVTTGTTIDFVQSATPGSFELPATSVVGVNAVAISPAAQTTAPGSPATYTITVNNPSSNFASFTLSLSGVPSSWVQLNRFVFVGPNSSATETLQITAPSTTTNGSMDFVVFAASNATVVGTAQGSLTLAGTPTPPDVKAHGVVTTLLNATSIAGQRTSSTYTVRLVNTGSESETFDLALALPVGVTGVWETAQITVPAGANNYRDVSFVLTPDVGMAAGPYTFTVSTASTTSNAVSEVTGELQVKASGVGLALNTSTGVPGDTFSLTVTNTGSVADTFDLALADAAGVIGTLGANSVSLAPGQSQVVTIPTVAITNAVPGTRTLAFTARSTNEPAVASMIAARLQISTTTGLTTTLDRTTETLTSPSTTDFTLLVDNEGNAEDAVTATVAGTTGGLTASLIGLDGLPTQTIPTFRLSGLARGAITIRVTSTAPGTGTFIVQVTSQGNGATASASGTITVNNSVPQPTTTPQTISTVSVTPITSTGGSDLNLPPPTIAVASGPSGLREFGVGAGAGHPADALIVNSDLTRRYAQNIFPGLTGGVRIAMADFNDDGVADIVAGTGPGTISRVVILDGANGGTLFSVQPFEDQFTGGVFVAAGDLSGDGVPDLVISPDEGGGPRVSIFNGVGFSHIADFFGIDDSNFRGGARVAVGDVDGDGVGDLIVSAGFGGGPRVAVFNGLSLGTRPIRLMNDFFLFEDTLRNGVYVAAGDLNGDGYAEVIGGSGPGGGPRILALNGLDLLTLAPSDARVMANFFGGNTENRGGIRVIARDLDGDTLADLVVGDGSGTGSRVTGYLGKNVGTNGTPVEAFAFDAFPDFTGGVFIG